MIDPPATPSFPAGHAVQSYLMSYLLAYSLPKLPQHFLPPAPNYAQATGLLFNLAARVSENRIVAGIHYPTDIAAGKAVAIACFTDLRNIPSIWGKPATVPPAPPAPAVVGIRQRIQLEFAQYV